MHFKVLWVAALLLNWTTLLQPLGAVTLDVDLKELRGAELLSFMRAVVPEVYGGESRKPIDLSTLATLHSHLAQNSHHGTREFQARARYNLGVLEGLMRRELAKIDLPTLRRMTLGEGKSSYGNPTLYPALYLRLIEAEVSAIHAEPKRALTFPAEAPILPDGFPFYPVNGVDDKALRRAVAPFAELLQKARGEEPRGIHHEGDAFGQLADALLRGRDKKAAGELLRFAWDSWCGTGLGEFENTQMTLVFIGLLRERRISEAVGASFLIGDSPEWLREPGRPFDQWRVDLLEWCGFDWEEVLIAAGRVEILAAAGSERAAKRELTDLETEWKKSGVQPWRLSRVTPFLIPAEPIYWEDTDPRKAISAETQAEIFRVLDSAVTEELGFHELAMLMDFFEELHRNETKETMRRLLKHPSTTFNNRAADVLNRLGERIEPVAPAPPVRFRFYLNNEPWRSVELNYGIIDPNVQHRGGGSLKTDAEGFATIPRDEFIDPAKRGTRMHFGQFPTRGGSSRWTAKPFDDPWVDAEIEVPKVFDEVTAVRFAACPLPVEIDYATPPELGKNAATRIKLIKAGKLDANEWGYLLDFGRDSEVPPSSFTLSTIAPGEYQFAIVTPGSARHVTPPFSVAPGMPPLRVKLKKGSHVYALLSMPENARGAGSVALYRGEQDISAEVDLNEFSDDSRPLFRGLPQGEYRLRVLSTAEYIEKQKIPEWKAPTAMWATDLRKGVDCEGLSIDFIIDDNSPALLDLGKLEIPPVPEMKKNASGVRTLGGAAPR
jgi:hypothetical protein